MFWIRLTFLTFVASCAASPDHSLPAAEEPPLDPAPFVDEISPIDFIDQSFDPETLERAMNNISWEYVTCAAYLRHVALGMVNTGEQELADRYFIISREVLTRAIESAQTGRTQEMAVNVTKARLGIAMDEMASEIENNYSNGALLIQKYYKRCQFVVRHTEEFMEESFEAVRSK